jgi:hypothetical protein
VVSLVLVLSTIYIANLSHACYLPHLPHSLWFHHPNNIWWSTNFE